MSVDLGKMQLLITSHVVHFEHKGQLYAYGPYAREIDLWADLFSEVIIASPLRKEKPPGDCLAFERGNIRIEPLKQAGGDSLGGKLELLVSLPGMVWGLWQAMKRADAIHVRCPGNLGLVGVLLAPLTGKPLVAKYAAQWDAAVNEPLSAKFQKFVLKSRWWKGPVTVYGKWPNQPSQIVPFFTSLLTAEQINAAQLSAVRPRGEGPLKVLYTGRLSRAKHVDTVLRAVAKAKSDGVEMEAIIVGVGPERENLEVLARELGVSAQIRFTGGIPFDMVIRELSAADVLVLLSETEGWPKSIAEGMAFGLVCVGSNRGFVPEMLSQERGIVAKPGDVNGLAEILKDVARNPRKYSAMRHTASAWAQRYSLEGLREAIRELLIDRWQSAGERALDVRSDVVRSE